VANKGLIETNVQNTFVISEKDLIGKKANIWVADNVAKGGLKEVKYSQILQYRSKPHGWLVTPGMRGDLFMNWVKDQKEHDQQWKQWWDFRPCLDIQKYPIKMMKLCSRAETICAQDETYFT
jgi:hypothetical protein